MRLNGKGNNGSTLKFILLSFVLTCSFVFFNPNFYGMLAQEIDVSKNHAQYNITPLLMYVEDGNNSFSFEKVSQDDSQWKNVGKEYVNFGYTKSAYWFKINLTNQSGDARRFLLEINFPTLDEVVVFRQKADGSFYRYQTGDTVPFLHREIADQNFVFNVESPPGAVALYLKVKNSGSFRYSALLYHPDVFLETRGKTLPLLWLLYGTMMFIAFLFFFLFLFSKDKNYLFFSLFSALLLAFQLTHRGFAFRFLWPGFPWWANVCSPFSLNLLTACGGLFYCNIMKIADTHKRVDYFLKFFAVVIFPLNAFVSLFVPLSFSLPATYYLLLPLIAFLVVWTVYYLIKGIRFARYFILGILNVGFFTIIGSLTALGTLPSTPLTEWSTEFGFMGLIIFSSLGLMDRIMKLNDELKIYKLKVDKKNEELEASNEELQAAMEELEAINEQLEKQYQQLGESQSHLLQAQKMEALGTLAGGIAHDFNNMLGGIMGSLSLIQMLIQSDPVENRDKIINFIETALESAQRAAEITKQLQTLSRRNELQYVPVDVNQSLKNVLQLCLSSFPKSVELDFKISEQSLPVLANPVQIEQVLINLCVNASHAMTIMREKSERQGGVLRVSADVAVADEALCALHPSAELQRKYVRIDVRDTGVGIPESIITHVFDPFFTTKKMDEGTGLGLSMVYSITTQHGGFIAVDSKAGEGSLFSVYIPLMEAYDGAAQTEEKKGILRGTGKILVIDDENTIASVAKEVLRECGYEPIVANDGWEGLRIYKENFPHIRGVVLDLSMPGLSGIEVLEQLKKIDPNVKVLMASGFIEDASLERARALGVNVILHKPYSAQELSKKVSELLE